VARGGSLRGRVVVVETLGRQVLVTIEPEAASVKVMADAHPAGGAQVDGGDDAARLRVLGPEDRRIEGRAA